MRREELNNTIASKPHRLHPLWILFSIGELIKELIIPVVIYLINIGSESLLMTIGKIGVILFVVFRMTSILFEWWNFHYFFYNNELRVQNGRFMKKKRFIPLDRIQGVQINSNFLHRFFGLTSITIDTAATEGDSSVKLVLIKRSEALRIQEYVAQKPPVPNQPAEKETLVEADNLQPSDCKEIKYRVSGKEIIHASLTSFSFAAVIPMLVGLLFKINEILTLEKYFDDALKFVQSAWTWMIVFGIVLFFVSVVFGMVLTYLRFGRYIVQTDAERIYIQKGVLNQSEWMIEKRRVQAVKFKKSFIRRLFGIVEVELVCAGAFGDEAVESNLLFPFISEKKALQLLPDIVPAFKVSENMNKLPQSALWVKCLRPSYFWIVVTAVLVYIWPDKWYFSILLLAIIMCLRILNFYNSRFAVDDRFIQMRSGSFSSEMFVTTKQKIEQLSVTESWLQRKAGLATLDIATRGTPIHHAESADIPKEAAVRYYLWYGN
ncbi:PH domain-containing protein [Bacillus gobiensis]|uniref:PH domain-containing protein n=1 Tax=Bacillus gobiensis TaxID=1441095 RepID=UPI003D25E3B3